VADGHLSIIGQELLEAEPPFLKSVTKSLVVEAYSGHRYFPDAITVAGSNHMSVCKPESVDTDQYRALRNMLRKVRTAPPPWARVVDELEKTLADYRRRGHEYIASLQEAVDHLRSGLSPKDLSDLQDVRARFERLHEQHLALLADGHLVRADDLRREELDPLQDDALAMVEKAGQRLSVDLGRRVRRRYIDAPEVGTDPEYDNMVNGRLAIHATVERLKAARYRVDSATRLTQPSPPTQYL
jgi:hypothetical protein